MIQFLYLLLFLGIVLPVSQAHAAVKIENKRLLVDNKPFMVKGVGYSPMPIGRHASDWGWPTGDPRPANIYDDPQILERDFKLLAAMNANTIRIWKGNNTTQSDGRFPNKLTKRTLDLAQKYNLKVIAGFWLEDIYPNDPEFKADFIKRFGQPVDFTNAKFRADLIKRFGDYVTAFKNHPAILFWAIGNENNYHLDPSSIQNTKALYSLANEMAQKAHNIEGYNYHPVALVNGELGNIGNSTINTLDNQMPYLDIWGVNVYRGASFGSFFNEFLSRSSKKALWISEFGIDAWRSEKPNNPADGYAGQEDQQTQGQWDGQLWDEIARNKDVTIGATVMEYSDEWWKPYEWHCGNNSPQCNSTHNHFGEDFPAFATHDGVLNDEWLGIMSIKPAAIATGPDIVTPRQVYTVLKDKWKNLPPILTGIQDRTVRKRDLISIIMTATDPEGRLKSFSARMASGESLSTINAAFSSNIQTGRGIFLWWPKTSFGGRDYVFVFTAVDLEGLETSKTMVIKVLK